MNPCPACNAPNQVGALFCEMCGTRLPSSVVATPAPIATADGGIQCPTCGHVATPGEAFCDECGTPLATGAPAQSAPQAQAAAPVASPAQPAPQAQYPAPTPLGGTATSCPSCKAAVIPGEAFCENCGASLLAGSVASTPAPAASVAPAQPAPPAQAPATPRYTPPATPIAPPPAAPVAPAPVAVAKTLADYVLVAADGSRIPLPAKAEALIGREDAPSNNYPDIDLNPLNGLNEGVGRRHARMFTQNGQTMLEDLNSTNGTLVNRQRLAAKQPIAVHVGDEIRFGKLLLMVQKA